MDLKNKILDQNITPNEVPSDDNFRRSLGLLDATMLVAGSMIGSGIFLVTAPMVRDVGSAWWVLALWVITGIITIFGALSYGELAGMMPRAGGQFVYIRRAWGELAAFLYGWSVFTVIQTGLIAAVAVAFANYTSIFFPSLQKVLFSAGSFQFKGTQLVAIFQILLLTWINSRGIQNGRIIQLVFTLAKIAALAGLILLGIAFGSSDVLMQNLSSGWNAFRTQTVEGITTTSAISGIALLMALCSAIVNPLFSSDAWNSVTFIAGEIKNPERNIPRSLLLGTLLVTTLYFLSNIAYFMLLPMNGSAAATDVLGHGIQFAQNDRVGSAAAEVMFGTGGGLIMAALIMVSTFGCNSGLTLSGARVYYAMAKEGLFFENAATLNTQQVPAFALWAQAIWSIVLCVSGKYGDLLDYLTFVSLLSYVVTVAGVYRLRQIAPDDARPYRVASFIPMVYIILASLIAIILLFEKTNNTIWGLLLVLLGVPVYYFIKKK